MYAQVEKPKENKSRAVANSVAQKKNSVKQGFGFVDNRPEALVQRKLLQKTANSTKISGINKLSASNSDIVQRISKEEHDKLYQEGQAPLGLRYQPGDSLPKETINGDQYSLQDERYRAETEIDKKFPQLARPSVSFEEYSKILNQSIELAVGSLRKRFFETNDTGLTLQETFDKVRSQGQLAIINSSKIGMRTDYKGAFASVGKGVINPEDFRIRIPIINAFDYDEYKFKLDQKWDKSWPTVIWPHILKEVQKRVHDSITLALGGKLDKYTIPPDFDDDPKEFLETLQEIDKLE